MGGDCHLTAITYRAVCPLGGPESSVLRQMCCIRAASVDELALHPRPGSAKIAGYSNA